MRLRSRRLSAGPRGKDSKPADLALRLGVHDLSRIEWDVSVNLPADGERRYDVEFSLEIPASAYVLHDPWERLQIYTRLQSPSEQGELHLDRSDVDQLRRDTLGLANRLKLQRDLLLRSCRAAASELVEALHPSLRDKLGELVEGAVELVAEMREQLGLPNDGPVRCLPEVVREWGLADEFLSHQLLDFLASAEKSVEEVLLGPGSRARELDTAWTDELRGLVATTLGRELDYRKDKGFINPSADSAMELSRFVEQGSRLKKHFQDVLFLDVESYMVDHRARNYTGVVAAALAAGIWLAFTLLPIGPGTRAGLGLGSFALVFAAAYAVKDRVKEVTRGWLMGRITRLYGQRAVTLRLPRRLDPDGQVLVTTRETFTTDAHTIDDALNRTVGRTRKVVRVHFKMRAELRSSKALGRAAIHSIKHIFRYDLSPLFARLDDSVKPVPVLDEKNHRIRLVDAPKEYRLPARMWTTTSEGVSTQLRGQLVLSKQGIDRIEEPRREG